MLNSGKEAGCPFLVCFSRQKCRTPAPDQGCWTAALGNVPHKGIHARLRPGLKSYMAVDRTAVWQEKKKKAKELEVENSGTIEGGNGNSQGTD